MFKVMYVSDGMGLAAPQVGVNKRLMVFNEEADPNRKDCEVALCNPVIVAKSDSTLLTEEGCLSFGEMLAQVDRHEWIDVEFQTIDGSKHRRRFEEIEAIVFQHEYDHLDRVSIVIVCYSALLLTIINRFSSLTR